MKNILVNLQEHLETGSRNISSPPIYDHHNITGNPTTVHNFSKLEREGQNHTRAIKETIYIMVNDSSLNRNIGKYHQPHMWDEDLFNTPELRLKKNTLIITVAILITTTSEYHQQHQQQVLHNITEQNRKVKNFGYTICHSLNSGFLTCHTSTLFYCNISQEVVP